MKSNLAKLFCCLAAALAFSAAADEVETVEFGAASVVYEYESAREGVATLSLNAVISETNDSLRGLKNSDRRRLSKLGQLIYQCKLLLYTSSEGSSGGDEKTPMLISRNYSLFTGVDLSLDEGERLGIKIRSMQPVDASSLFTPSLGGDGIEQELWQDLGAGPALNLRQIDLNVLLDGNAVSNAESIEIALRFPIFQLQKSAREWIYNFDLKDFKQAVRHADENCTAERFEELIDKAS
jgi:hypothetical protein